MLINEKCYLKIFKTCLYFLDRYTDLVTRPNHSSNSATNPRKIDRYKLLYITDTRLPGSDCYSEVFKVTLIVTALRWPSE
jgi:hypothetical protein